MKTEILGIVMMLNDDRVLLVNPWIYDFAAYDLWSRPLGLLYIASLLEEAEVKIDFIDCLDRFQPQSDAPLKKGRLLTSGAFRREIVKTPKVFGPAHRPYARYGMSLEVFKQELLKLKKPKIVLLHSIMTYWYLGAYKAAEIIKEIWPEVPIFLGGIYASLCPEHAFKNPYALKVVPGPFEEVAPEFWQNNLEKPLADKFSKISGKNIFSVWPAWHLYKKNPVRAILTLRGCPNRCPYCASAALYNKLNFREVKDVLKEIEEALKNYGAEEIVFYDDALTIGPNNRFDNLLEGLVKLKEKYPQQKLRLPNGIFVKSITENRALLMKKAGFKTIRLGLESTNMERQKELGAKVEVGDFEKAALYLQKAGFSQKELGAYILMGLPGKLNFEEVYNSAQYAKSLNFKPCLAEYAPTPKTPMWAEAVLESKFNLESEPLFHNNCFHPLRPEGFSFEKYWALKNKIHLK